MYLLRNKARIAPQGAEAVRALHAYLDGSTIEPQLRCLINIRVSRLLLGRTECAHAVDRAVLFGISAEQILSIASWRDTPVFDERQKAAFAWAELVTSFDLANVDAVFDSVACYFTDAELIDLTLAVATANFDCCVALVVQA